MLIFRHEDDKKALSPKQMQEWMQKAMEWIEGIEAKDKLVSRGNGLSFDESKVVRQNNLVTNGPFGDIKETIGGYIIVKANSADEAVELTEGCPILLDEENSIEIRKIAR